MITQSQFLPSLMEMDEDGMSSYLSSFQSWLTDKMPLIQFKSAWTEDDCAIFDEGLILLSAFLRARDFCTGAYRFSTVEKRVKNYFYYAQSIKTFLQGQNIIARNADDRSAPAPAANTDASVIGASFVAPRQTSKIGRPTKPRNIPEIPSAGAKDVLLRSQDSDDPLRQTLSTRPRHLHDYIHLLPEDLQKESLKISDLYDTLADESHKLEALVYDPKSTQKDRAYHRALLANTRNKLNNLWARIDVAYAEATGSTVSEEYKDYLSQQSAKANSELREKELCEYTKFDIDNMPEGEQRDLAKAARIERNKKFLRKTDRQPSDQHRQNLIDAATELHAWGIAITDSQVECCRSYGYEVPQDWIELPLEERKRLQADARNAKRREERARVRAEKQAAKQSQIQELKDTYTSGDLSVFN